MNARWLCAVVSLAVVSPVWSAQPTTMPARWEAPAAIRVVVEVIEATVDQKVLPEMDFQAIDPGRHRVGKLLETLGKNGSAALTFRFDDQVTPGNEVSLQSGQNVPYVTGSNISPDTKAVTHTINYQQIGAICNFRLTQEAGPGYPVTGSIEWSGVATTEIKISGDVNAPSFIKASMRFSSRLQRNAPLLMSLLSNVPGPSGGEKKTQVVLFRITADPEISGPEKAVPAADEKRR